jgi:hypothetical protein
MIPPRAAALIARWVVAVDRRKRIARSWRLYQLGLGLSAFYPARPRNAEVIDSVFRKALRGLEPGSSTPASGAEVLAGLRLRQVLEARLAEQSLWTWLRRSWRRILWILVPALVVLVALLAAVPPIRWLVFPPNRAEGKPWVASSARQGFPLTGVMSGPVDSIGRFHTLEEPSPSVTVDLEAVFSITKVEIDNRLDCCRDRLRPLALELSTDNIRWTRVAYRRADFQRWTASFPATPARFIRARIDRTSMLHLRNIRAY